VGRSDRRKLAGVVAGVGLVTALAGCSASSSGTGPLGGPGDPGQVCSPLRPGQVLSYGFTGVRNSGDVTVVIDRVGLADARGLRVLAAYVVPGTSNFLYGINRGYPPELPLSPGVDWAARQKADGATLRPMKKSLEDSLLLVIKGTGRRGTAKGVDIWYHAGSQQCHLQTATSLLTVDQPKCHT
jgi:hypothetical protein